MTPRASAVAVAFCPSLSRVQPRDVSIIGFGVDRALGGAWWLSWLQSRPPVTWGTVWKEQSRHIPPVVCLAGLADGNQRVQKLLDGGFAGVFDVLGNFSGRGRRGVFGQGSTDGTDLLV